MASRQLRKLRKQQELLNIQSEADERGDRSEDEPIVAKPRGNMFSGFAALGDVDDGANDDEDEDQNSELDEAAPEQTGQEPTGGEAGPPKKSRKKANRKKKKKGKQAASATPAGDERVSIDEIDRVLEELKLEAQRPDDSPKTRPSPHQSTSRLNELLRINFQHLKAMNEMRRLFGKAMDVAEVEERTQDNRQRALPQNMDLETFLSARAAQPGRGPQGNKSMFETILRSNPFIDGKKTWPRGTAQGLKMVRVTEGSHEEVEFAFAHDNTYDSLEGAFFGLVQMYDPMQIVYFLHRYPYHVSSLIQVSKVARQDQNSALAADLIERALFTFGRVSLSEFRKRLEKGEARMSFSRPENRQFYLAGYNLIQKLVLKGTYRTALEWAKLFLSINHDDPYAMINWIHVLAIRARESQWFIDFCNSALFDSMQITTSTYARQTLPLAYLQLKDTETAQSTLTRGMETVPWLYCSLFSALNLDTPKSIWGIQARDEDERLHTELYIHTAKDLWNTPQHIALLKDAAAAAVRVADPSTLPPGPSVPLATARFIYLDNTPSLMATVPRQMLHASPNFDFDPLPPAKSENVFSTLTQSLPWSVTEQDVAASRDGRAEGLRAAVARLRAEIVRQRAEQPRDVEGVGREELEWVDRELDRQEELDRIRADVDSDIGAGAEAPPPGERRVLPPSPPPPGLMNYLRYIMEPHLAMEIVDHVEEWEAPTGMPGGWGQGEGWEEEVDDWNQDEFEGVDDFEGGGVGEEESDRGGETA